MTAWFDVDESPAPDGYSRCRECGLDTPIDDQAAIEAHVADHGARARAMSAEAEVAVLAALAKRRAEIDAATPAAVTAARRAGATWQAIADALGMTRQAAHAKYAHRA